MFPACNFAFSPTGSATRSALQLHNPDRFAPVRAASTLQARCHFPGRLVQLLLQPPLPFRTFASFRIEAFNWFCNRSARLPTPPDLRLLPDADSIASLRRRITARDPLRFRRLAVPQTSWNLHHYAPDAFFGQQISVRSTAFSTKYIYFIFSRLRILPGV